MNTINLNDNLQIKKIEPKNEKDWWLIHKLEQDPLIPGYLWNLSAAIEASKYRYLLYDNIYNSPFTIYYEKSPIGFLQISPIYKSRIRSSVDLAYAIVKEERKKGYMKSILTNVSDYILEDNYVDAVELIIASDNKASQLTAAAAGFTAAYFSETEGYDEDFFVYQKTNNKPHNQWNGHLSTK